MPEPSKSRHLADVSLGGKRRLSLWQAHQVRWPKGVAMADAASPLLGGCDGREVGNKAAHGNQSPLGGSSPFLDDRVKGDGPVESERA